MMEERSAQCKDRGDNFTGQKRRERAVCSVKMEERTSQCKDGGERENCAEWERKPLCVMTEERTALRPVQRDNGLC